MRVGVFGGVYHRWSNLEVAKKTSKKSLVKKVSKGASKGKTGGSKVKVGKPKKVVESKKVSQVGAGAKDGGKGVKKEVKVGKSAKAALPVLTKHPLASGGTIWKRKVVEEAQQPMGEMSEEQLRKCKSGLSKKELEGYQEILLQKRAEILGDVDSIQADQKGKSEGGNLSNMPLHMADIGTDNYEQEFNLSLVESERRLLREIVDALIRLKKGIFGVCVATGKPIGKPRLDAKPWAKYCIEVVREKERRGEKVF